MKTRTPPARRTGALCGLIGVAAMTLATVLLTHKDRTSGPEGATGHHKVAATVA